MRMALLLVRRTWLAALVPPVICVVVASPVRLSGQTRENSVAVSGKVLLPRKAMRETPEQAAPKKTNNVITDNDRLRLGVRFMAGYGHDSAQASLGLEKQGRVGYAIVNLLGNINNELSYGIEINPVTETRALPACGEDTFFFPNSPDAIGPIVGCDPDGRTRVDDYRFMALDLVDQQGAIRQAYLAYQRERFGVKFGRFLLPIGFHWEAVGSFTSKDATHIQRINAEANFGVNFSLTSGRNGKGDDPVASVNLAAFLGDGNRQSDYNYFYFLNPDLDTNSALTWLLSGTFVPHQKIEFRSAIKRGYSGSKVERLPNYFASKRHDSADVLSVRYRPLEHLTAFGEVARYTWGPTLSSAEMLGVNGNPIKKVGYYAGIDVSVPVTDTVTMGIVGTREELSRDDSLIKYLTGKNLLNVSMGKKERSTVFRWYADIGDNVTLAFYRNLLSNPFPWVSGIEPISGPRAFTGRGTDKWGLVVRFQVP